MRRQTELCVAGGSHGLAVAGLATEVAKLTVAERRVLVEWALADLAGRLPLAVTVFGATIREQTEAVTHAAGNGRRHGDPAAAARPANDRGGADPLLRPA